LVWKPGLFQIGRLFLKFFLTFGRANSLKLRPLRGRPYLGELGKLGWRFGIIILGQEEPIPELGVGPLVGGESWLHFLKNAGKGG